MNCRKLFVFAIAVACATPLLGFEPEQMDPIERLLFPPELIMKHRKQLNLEDKQQTILKTELQRAQADVFDLNWQLNDESEHLAELLKMAPIDVPVLLAQADKVMALERQIKRINLTLLARLKNMLSKQQIEMLIELRKA